MELRSPAFGANEKLPTRYGFDGERISPPLEWADVPEGTRELALVLEDLTAHHPQPFVYWVAYRIPPEPGGLPEGFRHRATPKEPARIQQGMNSLEGHGYQPPTSAYGRRHKLMFHLYALDQPLPDRPGLHAWELMDEVEGHVLSEATLPAVYVREQR